ncbi:flagellar biosynthetic protein FliO [Lachnospiraceae bacterium 62-35]
MEGLTLFRAVLTVAGVLLLAYYCSRLLGKQWVKSSGSGGIKVIEHIQIGQDRKILLLKVGDHNYLVGVSQAGIQLLAEVEGDFQAEEPQPPSDSSQPPFQELLEKYLSARQKKGGGRDR